MKVLNLTVVIEPDEYEDGTPAFHAYCPALKGARTHAKTKEEALKNIREVVQMVAEVYREKGFPIPEIMTETVPAEVPD